MQTTHSQGHAVLVMNVKGWQTGQNKTKQNKKHGQKKVTAA